VWGPGDSSASLATSAGELEGNEGSLGDMVSTSGASGYTYWGPVLLTHPILGSGTVLLLVLSWDVSAIFTRFRFEAFALFAAITIRSGWVILVKITFFDQNSGSISPNKAYLAQATFFFCFAMTGKVGYDSINLDNAITATLSPNFSNPK